MLSSHPGLQGKNAALVVLTVCFGPLPEFSPLGFVGPSLRSISLPFTGTLPVPNLIVVLLVDLLLH